MYVVIVYDVGIERLNKVRIFLKQYLNWVQNSVLEGELTKAEYMRVLSRLRCIAQHHETFLNTHRPPVTRCSTC